MGFNPYGQGQNNPYHPQGMNPQHMPPPSQAEQYQQYRADQASRPAPLSVALNKLRQNENDPSTGHFDAYSFQQNQQQQQQPYGGNKRPNDGPDDSDYAKRMRPDLDLPGQGNASSRYGVPSGNQTPVRDTPTPAKSPPLPPASEFQEL